jgi:hypothetical protein
MIVMCEVEKAESDCGVEAPWVLETRWWVGRPSRPSALTVAFFGNFPHLSRRTPKKMGFYSLKMMYNSEEVGIMKDRDGSGGHEYYKV